MDGTEGKVMLVSGAAGGIGAAVARLWHARGGRAVGLDIIGGTHDSEPWDCDVTCEDAVAAAVARVLAEHGRLDAVVHCGGMLGPSAPAEKLALADWQRILDVHVTGGFLLAKHSLAAIAGSGGGSLTFIGSIVAEGGSPFYPAYAAAKAALVSLAMSVAGSSARRRVRANVINPGSVAGTGLLTRSRGYALTCEETALLAAQIPMGRAATVTDIAEGACFLASPAARHITGTVLVIDGGERLPRKPSPAGRTSEEAGHE